MPPSAFESPGAWLRCALHAHARLERPAFTPYGRLELRDDEGRRAWTNPLWVS